MSYSAEVERLFHSLPGAGTLEPGPGVFTCTAGSVAGGVCVEFSLRCTSGRVSALRFRAYGCPHTIAAAAWVTGAIRGCTLEEAGLDVHALAALLEVPAWKLGRLLVVEDALRLAITAARRARGRGDHESNGDHTD